MIGADGAADPIDDEDDLDDDQPGEPEVITETTEIEYKRPWLYPKQLEAIFDPARFVCIEASTKSGKTSGSLAWLIEKAMMGGGNGRNYWWVAPVSDQALIAFTRATQFLPSGSFNANKTIKTILLLNGAVIWFKGSDRADSLYGEDVYAAVFDEASRAKREAYIAVRTTLTATQGPIRFIGNVKGKKNWFWELSRNAQRKAHAELAYHRITAYDAVDAGIFPLTEVESARRDLPDAAFKELYLAEGSDDGSNPFGSEQQIRDCVRELSGQPVAAWGWDLAKKQDYTVGIGLDRNGHVAKLVGPFQKPWNDTINEIHIATGYAPALIDSTGVGDPILEMLQRKPGTNYTGYVFSGPSKQKLMEGLAASIQQRTVFYPTGPITIELEAFEYQHTRTGARYGAPEGMHDDAVCALALANIHLFRTPAGFDIPDDLLEASMQRY